MTRRLVIFDIDDTLFDWLTMWHTSFAHFLEQLTGGTGLSVDETKQRLRGFHVLVGTSEYPYGSDDLEHVFPELAPRTAQEIAQGLQTERRQAHVLFDGLRHVLGKLKASGETVVLHTDAPPSLAAQRLENMRIEAFVHALFSTVTTTTHSSLRSPLAGQAVQHQLSVAPKPDRRALLAILDSFGCQPSNAIYVGDSLLRDISMAQECGVMDVHAAYGCRRTSDEYELLRDVTHWTKADVERERQLQARGDVEPTISLMSPEDLLDVL